MEVVAIVYLHKCDDCQDMSWFPDCFILNLNLGIIFYIGQKKPFFKHLLNPLFLVFSHNETALFAFCKKINYISKTKIGLNHILLIHNNFKLTSYLF